MTLNRLALAADPGGALRSCPATLPALSALRYRRLAMCLVCLTTSAHAATAKSVRVAWDRNSETDIARYELNYGTTVGVYPWKINAGTETSTAVSSLQEGLVYRFAVTAINTSGLVSPQSSEVVYYAGVADALPTSSWTTSALGGMQAFDGDAGTLYLSGPGVARIHNLDINLGVNQAVEGLRYLPRQDGSTVGNIANYEVYLSQDGISWGLPVSTGTFSNSLGVKEVRFASRDAGYVRLRSLSEVNGLDECAVAELEIIQSAPPTNGNHAPVAIAGSYSGTENGTVGITLTASDVDLNPLQYTVLSAPAHGTLSGGVPNLIYRPAAGFSGTDSFTFLANDGQINSAPATISLIIAPINHSPVALAGAVAAAKNSPVPIRLTGTDPDGDTLRFALTAYPQHGSLSGNPPNLSYTPLLDFTGDDSFEFQVSDGTATSAPATVAISVARMNSAPAGIGAFVTLASDTSQLITLLGSDPDNDPLSFTLGIRPLHGTLTGIPPNLNYTPAPGYTGMDLFTFFASDGTATSVETLMTLLVNPTNRPPLATVQSVATSRRTPVAILLSATDPEGAALTYSVVSSPAHGSLTGTPPRLTYTPTGDFFGSDSFLFRANDGKLDSPSALVSITINDTNTVPVISSGSLTVAESTPLALVLTALDKESDPLTFRIVATPLHGILTGISPNYAYQPDKNFRGTDYFTYVANDGRADSLVGVMAITVTPVNQLPIALAQSVATPKRTPLSIKLTATDPNPDVLTYAIVAAPAHGTLAGTAPLLTYTPAADFVGNDSFTFRANDGTGDSAPAIVSIAVAAVNQAPLATAKSVTTPEDTPISLVLTGTDPDSDLLTFAVISSPTKGTLSGTPPNLTYSPSANFNGTDSFTFRVNDSALNSALATVSISVTPVNDAPVALGKSITTPEDTPVSIVLTGTDVDNDALTFSILGNPVHGTLSGTPPNLTYTPQANFNGTDGFTFRANDGTVSSPLAAISILVTPVNDAPVALGQTLTTVEGTPLPIKLSGLDVDGDALTFSVVGAPTRGTISGTAPNLTYLPAAGYFGTDSLTFLVRDGTASSAPASVGILVTKRPTITGTTVVSRSGWSLKYVDSQETFDGLATSAFDGDPTTSWHTQWRSGTLTPTPHEIQINLGSSLSLTGFQYLPRQDASSEGNIGSYEFYVSADGVNWGAPVATGNFENSATEKQVIFTARTGQYIRLRALTEANGNTGSCVAELNILQGALVNQLPSATPQTVATKADTPLGIHLAGSDPEGFALSYTLVTAPLHGTLSGKVPDLTYLATAGFQGADEFSYRVNDGADFSEIVTVSISVITVPDVPGNHIPAFASGEISLAATQDSGFEGQLVASDADVADILTFQKLSGPAWLSISPEGGLTGTPRNADVGGNTFSVKVSDPSNASATATLIVTVAHANDAPAFKTNPLVYTAGTEKMKYRDQSLAATAVDPDLGDSFLFSKVSGPEWLTVEKSGALGGTPPAGSAGLNTFTVRVTDLAGASTETTLQIKVNANTLPLPWNLYRVGTGNIAGGAKYTSGVFTVAGAGALTDSEDAGNFGWQTLSNDGAIIARVRTLDNTGTATRVGIMIRESLASNARQVFMGVDGNGKYQFLSRAVSGGKASRAYLKADSAEPIWLRLVRKGNTVSAYKSNDGLNWTKVGKTNIQLPKNCYMGLSVSSGTRKSLNTSKFTNVKVAR